MAGLQSRPQFKLTPLDVSEGRVTVDTVTRPFADTRHYQPTAQGPRCILQPLF